MIFQSRIILINLTLLGAFVIWINCVPVGKKPNRNEFVIKISQLGGVVRVRKVSQPSQQNQQRRDRIIRCCGKNSCKVGVKPRNTTRTTKITGAGASSSVGQTEATDGADLSNPDSGSTSDLAGTGNTDAAVDVTTEGPAAPGSSCTSEPATMPPGMPIPPGFPLPALPFALPAGFVMTVPPGMTWPPGFGPTCPPETSGETGAVTTDAGGGGGGVATTTGVSSCSSVPPTMPAGIPIPAGATLPGGIPIPPGMTFPPGATWPPGMGPTCPPVGGTNAPVQPSGAASAAGGATTPMPDTTTTGAATAAPTVASCSSEPPTMPPGGTFPPGIPGVIPGMTIPPGLTYPPGMAPTCPPATDPPTTTTTTTTTKKTCAPATVGPTMTFPPGATIAPGVPVPDGAFMPADMTYPPGMGPTCPP